MPRYPMQDGTVVDTERATESWLERRDEYGTGRSSGAAWRRQRLYRSRRGRYYVEFTDTGDQRVSARFFPADTRPDRGHVEWQSPEAATRWLIVNDYDLPEELKRFEEEV